MVIAHLIECSDSLFQGAARGQPHDGHVPWKCLLPVACSWPAYFGRLCSQAGLSDETWMQQQSSQGGSKNCHGQHYHAHMPSRASKYDCSRIHPSTALHIRNSDATIVLWQQHTAELQQVTGLQCSTKICMQQYQGSKASPKLGSSAMQLVRSPHAFHTSAYTAPAI